MFTNPSVTKGQTPLWFLEIGDYTWIGEKVWIDKLAKVTIGSNVCIFQGALLLCGNHNYKKPTFDLMVKEITLEDGVWIGANAVVCPGVICKSHSVVTVGSVVTKNTGPYSIYSGNPAVRVKMRLMADVRKIIKFIGFIDSFIFQVPVR